MSDTESFPSLTATVSNTNTSRKNKTNKIPKTAATYLPPIKGSNSDGSLFYTRNNLVTPARAELAGFYTDKVNKAFSKGAVYEEDLETGETAKIGPSGQRYPVKLPPVRLPPITKGGIKTRKAKRSKKTRKHKRRLSTYKKIHSRIR